MRTRSVRIDPAEFQLRRRNRMEELTYQGIPVNIEFDPEESERHIRDDFEVLKQYGIERIIREFFIPWLKGSQFQDLDDERIRKGLRLYDISYHYGRIIARYSPTGRENHFGQFELSFDSCDDYTSGLLEACALQVYILDGEIVKTAGYDI
jgi:hypothetical protein